MAYHGFPVVSGLSERCMSSKALTGKTLELGPQVATGPLRELPSSRAPRRRPDLSGYRARRHSVRDPQRLVRPDSRALSRLQPGVRQVLEAADRRLDRD